MLETLLDTYTKAFLPEREDLDSNFNDLVLKSVPKLKHLQAETSVYQKLIQVCSYTASLTDGFTVSSFKRYQGSGF